jgi:predicted dehydrogenase
MVGVGGIAGLTAPVFATIPTARLVAVAGRDAERVQAFATEHGVARSYGEYEALLADPQVEVVYLATPNWLHAEQTLQALAAGKHVLVEKPMALTVADAEGMVAAARSVGRQIGVGFHLRHHPVFRNLYHQLRQEDHSPITLAQAQWGLYMAAVSGWKIDPALAGAGSVMGLGVHLIDLLRWLVGQEVVAVSALADGPSERYAVEFLTLGLLEFGGGTYGQITCSRRLPYSRNSVTVYTPSARFTAEGAASMQAEGELIVAGRAGEDRVAVPLHNPYEGEIEAFSRAVRDGTPFAASGEDGLQVVRVTVALLEAVASGRVVTMSDSATA